MSWLFSQALVEGFSRATCSAGEPYAQLNVMPTAQPFWRNAKPMECSRFSRFGLTFQRLTADRGAALLTWFRAGFPVRTSASPAQAPASTASGAASGFTWLASFAKYDLGTRSWRTRQLSLLGDLAEYWETWPRWGAMRDGECWELPTSERPIFERGSGLLPTPCAIDSGSLFNQSESDGAELRPTLGAMARFGLWPTSATDQAGTSDDFDLEQHVMPVERQRWPTPTVKGNYNRQGLSRASGDGLATAVQRLPTPTATIRHGSSQGALTRKSGRSRAHSRLDYAIEQDASHGRLNPAWVEWLMGWPIGWTALQPLETDKFREWQQQHGDCCNKPDRPR